MYFPYRRLVWAVLASLMLVLATGSAAWAEAVTVRGASHKGYGRIVFNWPSPVTFTAAINGKLLNIRFGRPIEASYGGVLKRLRKYLQKVEPGADGRSVTFSLKDNFSLRKFDMGAAVVVDILDKVSSATPKAVSEKAIKTANKEPRQSIGVRSGAHKGYSRIVFDWPRRVAYKLKKSGNKATITFASPARIRLGSLQKRPPKYVRGISSDTSANSVTVSFTVPETSKVRHSYLGPKVVVDIIAPSPKKPTTASSTPTGKVKKAEPSAKVKSASSPTITSRPGSTAAAVGRASKPVAAARPPTALAPPTALVPPPTAAKKGVVGPDGSAPTIAAAPSPAQVRVPAVSVVPLKGVAGAVAMRFDWNEPVGAAVFRRAGFLWVVFDKPSMVDVKKLRASGGNLFRGIEQLPSKVATNLKFKTVAGINPGLKRDGLAWILEFRKRPLQARIPIEPKAQPNSPVGARVFIPVNDPGKAVVLKDPEVGDTIVVIPVIPLGYGVFQNYRYPQFEILMSAQGVVIHSRIDGLRVRPLRQGIEIISAGGLKLSSPGLGIITNARLGAMRPMSRVFDLKKMKQVDLSALNSTKQKLSRNAAKAKAKSLKREKSRMNLARFYFANGFDSETLGVLRLVGEDNPGKLSNPEFRAMRGTSSFLMGRLKDARVDLYDASLNGNDEGMFLRSELLAAEGDMARSARNLRRAGAVMRKYPKALKMPLTMLAAEAAIAIGDIKQANSRIDEMKNEKPGPAQQGQLDYVEGKLKELEGDFEGAIGKWEDAMAGPHRPSRAKAAFARAELLLKLRKITTVDAINEMEKLRFAWRGGDFEFNLLRRLGKLYVEEGDFRDGLRTLRQAVTNFRDNKNVGDVSKNMSEIFNKLYLEGGAKSLSPVTAIALYDEFKELTPPGAKGDEMIRRLADYLVGLDLLDQGAKLLENQIKFRLDGEEKARVGARLALVRIMAREPKKALAALEDSDVKGISGKLSDQRRHLKAQIMIALNRNEDALGLLKEDKSIDAKLLREELYWDAKDWPRAAQGLWRMAKDFNIKPKSPLDKKQSKLVLNLVVALTLGGDSRGLDIVRRDYGAAMENTPLRDAFRLIASPDTKGLIAPGSIAGKVKDVEKFQTFLTSFREQLSAGGLSLIN